jgi:hypothetical protein
MDVILENGFSYEMHGSSLGAMRLIAYGGYQGGILSSRAWISSIDLQPKNGRQNTNLMLVFDGTFDYLVVADFVELNGEFTIAFWMKSAGFRSESNAVMSIGPVGGGIQIVQCLHAGSICFYSEGSKMLVGRSNVDDGLWHHVAVTFSLSSNRTSIYVDGALDASRNDALRIPLFGSQDFYVGRGGLLSISYFPGSIDDLFIWSSALSAAQVSALAADQTMSLNPVASWSFDNVGLPFMQQSMFPSVQQNFIMYCGGNHGSCPTLSASSAPIRAGIHSFVKSNGWTELPVFEGSPQPPARHSHAAACVSRHLLLIHGGYDRLDNVLDDVWLASIVLGKFVSWTQLFQPQSFRLYAHSLLSRYNLPDQSSNQAVTILSHDGDSTRTVDYGQCKTFM